MEEKFISAIDKIVRLCAQDPEFDNELRKRLGIPTPLTSISLDDDRINQIYEYCMEKVVRKQAEDFYSDFPIPSIINNLVDDYCRMEFFRRKDAFGDFCLALYQQIECISNKICSIPDLNIIAEHFWGYPAYVKSGKDIKISINNRKDDSEYSIASLVFMSKAVEKSKTALHAQYAIDNMKADWNENALKTAETYSKTMSMSKDRIYSQLTSEYGEKFTAEEAQYAIDHLDD